MSGAALAIRPMRPLRRAFAVVLLLVTASCGPTLTRGPTGWHESIVPYSVAPLADGALFAAGWGLRGYVTKDDGFRRDVPDVGGPDFELVRVEDDGAMFVASYPLEEADRAKLPEVLADRWIARVVQNPSNGE